VPGATDASLATGLAALVAPKATLVSVLTPGRPDARAIAAASRRPALLAATTVPRWLAAHPRVTHVLALGGWTDASVGRLAVTMAARTAATTPTAPTTPAAPAPRSPAPAPGAVPSSFSFTGSGFGHGVGMSQWGAYGMALAGSSAAQIVQHYYTGTAVMPVTDSQDIRVNIAHAKPTVYLRAEALAAGGGGLVVTVTGAPAVLGDASDVFAVNAGAGSVTVTRTRAGVTTPVGTGPGVTVTWAGTRYAGAAGAVPTVLDVATTVTGLAGSGHRYRYGFVDIAPATTTSTTLEVVNSVRLHDEYLLGIGEVSNSWPMAALQAQVLASRTYALARTSVRAACRCQVDNGAGPYYDQTFAGWSKESGPLGANWQAAVASTWASPATGYAILYGGRPITAFYFSSSGGSTQSSQDVWVTSLPYAVSVDDHWAMVAANPYRTWVPRVRTQAQVAAAFALPDVVRIDLSARTAGGGVKVAVAWSSTGATASLTGESLRSRLGLPGTWVAAATPA
jgi:SpoIID/LytB domain protein